VCVFMYICVCVCVYSHTGEGSPRSPPEGEGSGRQCRREQAQILKKIISKVLDPLPVYRNRTRH